MVTFAQTADPAEPDSVARRQEMVSVAVAHAFEDVPLRGEEWDEAVASLDGSVYMTWEWLRTWWRFYGSGRELRLIVCSEGQQVVGLIPLYVDTLGLWPLRLRVARLVGANIPPKVFDPPLAKHTAGACIRQVVRRLIEKDRCDVVSLGPISSTHEAWRSLAEEMAVCGAGVRVERDGSEVHALFRLPESHEDYLQSLGRKERKNRLYELRSLEKEHQITVDVVSGPQQALLEEFDRFAPLHRLQWEAEGKAGHFGSWPDGLACNRALVEALGPLDRVRFVRLIADGTVVSSQYVFAFAGRWYWELPARLPGPPWERFGLGRSGAVAMIHEAIASGVRWIQGGLGHYDYKLRLQATEHPAVRFRIIRSALPSRMRAAAFEGLRWMMRVGYHKLWYRRVAPRLPSGFRGPQWRWWLRLDF